MTVQSDNINVQRGQIYVAHYNFMGKWRTKPVLVIQNDIGNKLSPLVIVAPIVPAENNDINELMSVYIDEGNSGILGINSSSIMLNIILTLDKTQLMDPLGVLPDILMEQVEKGLLLSLGIKVI